MVAKMAKIGLVPGQHFDANKCGPLDKEAIKAVPKLAQVKIVEYFKHAAEPVNGWTYSTKDIGVYGTNYIQRPWPPPSAWVPTVHRTLSIQLRKKIRMAMNTTETKSMSCTSTRASSLRWTASGP